MLEILHLQAPGLLAAVCGWAGAHWALRGTAEQQERGEEQGEEAAERNSENPQSWERGCPALSSPYQHACWEVPLPPSPPFGIPVSLWILIGTITCSLQPFTSSFRPWPPGTLVPLTFSVIGTSSLSPGPLYRLRQPYPCLVTSGFPERSSSSSSSTKAKDSLRASGGRPRCPPPAGRAFPS